MSDQQQEYSQPMYSQDATLTLTLCKDPEYFERDGYTRQKDFARVRAVRNWSVFNKQSGQWEERPPMFLTLKVWDQGAQTLNMLKRGDPVLAQGRLEFHPPRVYKSEASGEWKAENRVEFAAKRISVEPHRYEPMTFTRKTKQDVGQQVEHQVEEQVEQGWGAAPRQGWAMAAQQNSVQKPGF